MSNSISHPESVYWKCPECGKRKTTIRINSSYPLGGLFGRKKSPECPKCGSKMKEQFAL